MNGTVVAYEMMFTTNNSFESDTVLGLYHPTSIVPSILCHCHSTREGEPGYCDTLSLVMTNDRAFSEGPIFPYIAIETGQPYSSRLFSKQTCYYLFADVSLSTICQLKFSQGMYSSCLYS